MTTCKLSLSSRRRSIWTDSRCDWIFTCWVFTHIFSRFVRLTLWCVSGSDWRQDDTRETAGGRRQAQGGGSHAHCVLTHLAFYSLMLSMYKTWTLSYLCFHLRSTCGHFMTRTRSLERINPLNQVNQTLPGCLSMSTQVLRVSVCVCQTPCCCFLGRCYKVPEGLDDVGKRKRKRASCLQDFRSWFRGTCEEHFDVSHDDDIMTTRLWAGNSYLSLQSILLSRS